MAMVDAETQEVLIADGKEDIEDVAGDVSAGRSPVLFRSAAAFAVLALVLFVAGLSAWRWQGAAPVHTNEMEIVGKDLIDQYTGQYEHCLHNHYHQCPNYWRGFHCAAGSAIRGCRHVHEGPFPTYDCTHQCLFNTAWQVSEPFDCNAGFANWQAGWSEAKKVYCCAHHSRGCSQPVQAPVTAVQTPTFCSDWDHCELCRDVNQHHACPGKNYGFLCMGGNANQGCRTYTAGPFPSMDCSSQCKFVPAGTLPGWKPRPGQ